MSDAQRTYFKYTLYTAKGRPGKSTSGINKSAWARKSERGRRRRTNCSRLHQRHRGGGPPIRSNIVSSAANITASSGSTPYNARWDVSGAAGSPNEDKSHPKWRPNLFPAPPLSLSLCLSIARLSLSPFQINLAAAFLHFPPRARFR